MQLPDNITGFRSRAINGLIEAVRRSRIRSGRGYSVSETPGGTILNLAERVVETLFPWGAQWAWGYEILNFGTSTLQFRVHNAWYYDGQVAASSLLVDGTNNYATLTVDSDDWADWTACVMLDWGSTATRYGAVLCLEGDDYPDETDYRGRQTIKIARFQHSRLVADYIHGAAWPQIWTR